LDQSGIATSEAALADLLETDFVIENGRIIPTSVWRCADVFEENRNYYFYEANVRDPVRAVLTERTLSSVDDTRFSDLTFFWSVTSADSILLASVISGENGNLVSSGQQYDVTTIRFTEVDSRQVFSAQSLLRGSLTCAAINLR